MNKGRCLRWSLSLVVPLRGSKLRGASVYDTLRERREVRTTPTQYNQPIKLYPDLEVIRQG
ncbi:MAG: hypothetical protein V7L09_14930 [Nostoc sp.]